MKVIDLKQIAKGCGEFRLLSSLLLWLQSAGDAVPQSLTSAFCSHASTVQPLKKCCIVSL